MPSNPKPCALQGIRVLDLTRILAGPLCTMMLGDMGADVIKVEPPGAGDDTRSWGPPFAEGESAYYLGVNRNKRSITLNMAVKSGQEVLAGLIRKSDVLVENFKVGTLEKWGFGNDWLQEHAPKLVRCSITGYGSVGPKAGLPGYDFILQAESGLMSITGEPGGTPMKYGVAIVDVCTGMLACNSVLAALNARHTTGRGQHVEVSLFDSGLAMLANVASNHLISGKNAGRFGNGHPNIVPYTAYPTRDDMIAVAVGNDGQFAKFAAVLGHVEWVADPRFTKNPDRVGNREAIDALISAELKREGAEHWIEQLTAAGIPCGRINSVAQALAAPHAVAREMVTAV
ncbi:MAG: CoA transferase, partial [Betaproteobacteria bacterium]|nr:CoA transferase [Betaproteobacteria bacterium]